MISRERQNRSKRNSSSSSSLLAAALWRIIMAVMLQMSTTSTVRAWQSLQKARTLRPHRPSFSWASDRNTQSLDGFKSRTRLSSSQNNKDDPNQGSSSTESYRASARDATQSLLSSMSKRMNTTQIPTTPMQPMILDMLQSTIQRAYSTTQTLQDAIDDELTNHSTTNTTPHYYEFPFATRYRNHPAISNVALAHALWATVLRPNVDTAIDATCGNGYDSVKLAQLLFAPERNAKEEECIYSQLLCLDIQPEACDKTQRALQEYFHQAHSNHANTLYRNHVQVLHASHEILPRPTNTTSSSIGLVVYNLGWLPNRKDRKECTTKMETTLASITDAALLVRNGGMISVVTYPATGPEEDVAVRLFLECLALLSSNTRTWQGAIKAFVDSQEFAGSDVSTHIADHVQRAMKRVIAQRTPNQTWRVTQHDKLGMDNAPILITATRIK